MDVPVPPIATGALVPRTESCGAADFKAFIESTDDVEWSKERESRRVEAESLSHIFVTEMSMTVVEGRWH